MNITSNHTHTHMHTHAHTQSHATKSWNYPAWMRGPHTLCGQVEAECGEIAMVLVQTKVDLIDKAVVDKDEVEQLAEQLGLKVSLGKKE